MGAYFRLTCSSVSTMSYLEPNWQMMITWKISSSSLSTEACAEMVVNTPHLDGRNVEEEGSSSDDAVAEELRNNAL